MRLLITGSWGQLGQALLRLGAHRGHECIGIDMDDLDIRDREATLTKIGEIAPQAIIHCAARTDVDGCEKDPGEVRRVNAAGPLHVTQGAKACAAPCFLVSTDFVFDGTKNTPYLEDDPVMPLCVYGSSKAEGERLCLEAWPEGVAVVRTQWLYGPGGKHFVGAILRRAREVGELKVVEDQTGCPTLTDDLAEALLDMVAAGVPPGIYHASNEGSTTWHGLAQAILACAGLTHVPCAPIAAASLDLPARRPAYSVLSKGRLEAAIGRPMRHWRAALEHYLHELGGLTGAPTKEG